MQCITENGQQTWTCLLGHAFLTHSASKVHGKWSVPKAQSCLTANHHSKIDSWLCVTIVTLHLSTQAIHQSIIYSKKNMRSPCSRPICHSSSHARIHKARIIVCTCKHMQVGVNASFQKKHLSLEIWPVCGAWMQASFSLPTWLENIREMMMKRNDARPSELWLVKLTAHSFARWHSSHTRKHQSACPISDHCKCSAPSHPAQIQPSCRSIQFWITVIICTADNLLPDALSIPVHADHMIWKHPLRRDIDEGEESAT